MAYPPSYREMAPPLPSIVVPGGDRYASSHDMSFPPSNAMAIPGIEHHHHVPPPLPPPPEPFGRTPRHPDDIKRERRDLSRGESFASTYSSMAGSSFADERPSFKRRDTGGTSTGDEGYASYASTDRSRDSQPTDFVGLQHSKFHFQSAADIHGDSMKKKLDSRPLERSPPRSLLTSSVSDLSRREQPRLVPSLSMPVQLPIHSRAGPPDSREASFYSANSPRSANYHHTPLEHRSPVDGSEYDHSSPRNRSRRNTGDAAYPSQSSYEFHAADEMDMDETHSLRRLQLDEMYAAAGQKRRAASPPPDEYLAHGAAGLADSMRRRDTTSRSSPTARLATIPQGQSLSQAATAPSSRSNSYLSTLSIPQSSAYRSGGISPSGLSPTTASGSSYTTPASLNPSPRGSISRTPLHTRGLSGASPRKIVETSKGPVTKLQGFYMCECCPKKPKKFETAEELAAHEAEKQYECSFCGNRFKNKNEAERHQNSLHVRRHSWSCSALSGYDRAFHDSTGRPGEADTCGYCGDEFARTGPPTTSSGNMNGGVVQKRTTDQDWEERIRHLQEVHKFRECNSSKKFYRADHFRQHLKHSHAGTSGKWTNMLENACLLDEDPTPR